MSFKSESTAKKLCEILGYFSFPPTGLYQTSISHNYAPNPCLPLVGICRGITKILFIVIFSLMHKLKLKNCIYLKTLAEISSMDATNLVIEGSVSKVKYIYAKSSSPENYERTAPIYQI